MAGVVPQDLGGQLPALYVLLDELKTQKTNQRARKETPNESRSGAV